MNNSSMVQFIIRAKDTLVWEQLRGAVEWALSQYEGLTVDSGNTGFNIQGELLQIERLQFQLRELFKGFPLTFKTIATL